MRCLMDWMWHLKWRSWEEWQEVTTLWLGTTREAWWATDNLHHHCYNEKLRVIYKCCSGSHLRCWVWNYPMFLAVLRSWLFSSLMGLRKHHMACHSSSPSLDTLNGSMFLGFAFLFTITFTFVRNVMLPKSVISVSH